MYYTKNQGTCNLSLGGVLDGKRNCKSDGCEFKPQWCSLNFSSLSVCYSMMNRDGEVQKGE